jgi:formylglycine-generating enzyme required for sulfatase activity
MIVVPAGSFVMGSPPSEKEDSQHNVTVKPFGGALGGLAPKTGEEQHNVTVAKPFAVSKFELTFDEWDTCVANGDCTWHPSDSGWGRGQQPVINVSWDDAQQYVAWLAKVTGKAYRLLSEAEYEYAARAGTQTTYPWGDDIGKNNANCAGCGSQWDNRQTAPVGSFSANKFGLYDMVGNVWEWVEDCYHADYNGAPQDGSARTEAADCSRRVVRGGGWYITPDYLRSAHRDWDQPALGRRFDMGFRVGRTLIAP